MTIPESQDTEEPSGQPMSVMQVPLQMLRFHPRNIRGNLGDLTELAASIRAHGVLVPLMAERRESGGLRLLHGHRRWAAADMAGRKRVPVHIVPEHTDDQAMFIMLAEDKKLAVDGADRAKALNTLHTEFGHPWEAIARQLGISMDELTLWRLGQSSTPRPADAPRLRVPLTERERQVLSLMALGCSNGQIGGRLFLSEDTVKTHARRLFKKLDVPARTAAVIKGRDLGLLLPAELLPAAPAHRQYVAPKRSSMTVRPARVHEVVERWEGRAPASLLAELRELLGDWQPKGKAS